MSCEHKVSIFDVLGFSFIDLFLLCFSFTSFCLSNFVAFGPEYGKLKFGSHSKVRDVFIEWNYAHFQYIVSEICFHLTQ